MTSKPRTSRISTDSVVAVCAASILGFAFIFAVWIFVSRGWDLDRALAVLTGLAALIVGLAGGLRVKRNLEMSNPAWSLDTLNLALIPIGAYVTARSLVPDWNWVTQLVSAACGVLAIGSGIIAFARWRENSTLDGKNSIE